MLFWWLCSWQPVWWLAPKNCFFVPWIFYNVSTTCSLERVWWVGATKDSRKHSWRSRPARKLAERSHSVAETGRGKHLQRVAGKRHGILQWELLQEPQRPPPLEIWKMQFLSASRRKVGERCWGTRKPWGCSWVQGWWQVYVQVLKVHKVWQEGILTSAWRRLDYSLKIHLLSSWWWLIKSRPPKVSSDVPYCLHSPKRRYAFGKSGLADWCKMCICMEQMFATPGVVSPTLFVTHLRRCLAELHLSYDSSW